MGTSPPRPAADRSFDDVPCRAILHDRCLRMTWLQFRSTRGGTDVLGHPEVAPPREGHFDLRAPPTLYATPSAALRGQSGSWRLSGGEGEHGPSRTDGLAGGSPARSTACRVTLTDRAAGLGYRQCPDARSSSAAAARSRAGFDGPAPSSAGRGGRCEQGTGRPRAARPSGGRSRVTRRPPTPDSRPSASPFGGAVCRWAPSSMIPVPTTTHSTFDTSETSHEP